MTTNLVFLLAARPYMLKRAQKEVDETFQTRDISIAWPGYDECRSLPFLDACIREGLRFVASSFPRRRCSQEGSGFFLDGKLVPAGTSVSSSASEIGRHRKLYGDDADEFNPDRWLQATPEQLRLWGSLDVHWGFGVRKCLGKHIGSMVLYKSLVQVSLENPCTEETCSSQVASSCTFSISNWKRKPPSTSGASPRPNISNSGLGDHEKLLRWMIFSFRTLG